MSDTKQLDEIYHVIMGSFVRTGKAPHYTEIARALSSSAEESRKLLHELMGIGIPAWLSPGTDTIASFTPFHNLPTQYRISVDGQQKWFGQ